MGRYRDEGPSVRDINMVNSRLLKYRDNSFEQVLPQNSTYATKTNIDRMAINDGIFANHLMNTHSKDPKILPPLHTVCIKAGDLQWKVKRKEYKNFNKISSDIFYACVGEAHVRNHDDSKTMDPMLKLYKGRPVMITDNMDVVNCIANGTMCEFEGVELRDGISYEALEIIVIDGYNVWCAHMSQIECVKLKLLDGLSKPDELKYCLLKSKEMYGKAHFPVPLHDQIDKSTMRLWRAMKFSQFPIVCANARTIHKLQGRSIDNLVISNWDYTGNWIYVALSRVRELKGLHIFRELEHSKCKGMSLEVKNFMDKLRKKFPPDKVVIRRYC